MGNDNFVSLHNHTDNSILDGYSKPSEYISRAVSLGQRGLGITDHGNLFGIFKFLNSAKSAGITGIPGCEFYMAPLNPNGAQHLEPVFYGSDGGKSKNDVSSRGAYLHLTVWAYNNVGLYNLFKLSTLSNDPSRFYKKPRIDFDLLAEHSDGLIVATGCPSSEISTRFLLGQDREAYDYAGRLKEVFGDRLFVEIMDHNMSIDLERKLLPKQLELSKKMGIPLLATNDCHYAHEHDAKPHEEMLAIQSGSRMADESYDNGGSRFAFEGTQYYLKTADQMAKMFPEEDFPNALSNTLLVAEMATDLSFAFNPHLKPKPILPEGFDDEVEFYKHLINKGFKERYGNASAEVKEEAVRRNKQEFKVIHSSDFIGYMLVVRDYLEWAKKNFSTRDELDNILASSIGVGRGCFEPGSMIITDKGHKTAIENIKIGSKVRTHDTTYQVVEDLFVYDVVNEPMVELTLSNGEKIKSTSDHMIFKKDAGFLEAKDLNPGDTLLSPRDTKNPSFDKNDAWHDEVTIVSKREYVYTGKVYDIQVANVHNYTVGGVTVHNSVGGSIHAFELGISEIDPIKHDLLFERFLSAGRGPTYRLTYDDGTTETIVVSERKKVEEDSGNFANRYIHQLSIGDTVIVNDENKND